MICYLLTLLKVVKASFQSKNRASVIFKEHDRDKVGKLCHEPSFLNDLKHSAIVKLIVCSVR